MEQDDFVGLVEFAGHGFKRDPDKSSGVRRWKKNLPHNCANFEKRAVISLAGPEAQGQFRAGSRRAYHGAADYKHVLDMLDRFLWRPEQRDSSEEQRAYIRLLEIRTRDLVKAWWPQIEALAAELANRKRLTGR